jgi:hypothetical protein
MRHAAAVLSLALALLIGPAGAASAQAPPKPAQPAFSAAWQAILGEWYGVGSGQPGQGEGTFTFKLELDGRIIVRRNHNDIPASASQPASVHDDLMLVYPTERPTEWRALYADNEGHVIGYRARWTADGKKLSFQSDITPGQPRYRLTYTLTAPDEMVIGFEIAAPGMPDAFKPYLTGKARRNKLSGVTGVGTNY